MQNSNLSQQQKLRTAIQANRRALTPQIQQQAAIAVFNRFQQIPSLHSADKLAFYLPINGELETFNLIQYCWDLGKSVYLPVINPDQKSYLLFLRFLPTTILIANRYGILEPKLDITKNINPSQLDIIGTPLVAFDQQGQRLGMGGGYYDRVFSFCKQQNKNPLRLGLAHDCQYIKNLPSNEWDMPLDQVLTPSRHWQWP